MRYKGRKGHLGFWKRGKRGKREEIIGILHEAQRKGRLVEEEGEDKEGRRRKV